MKLPHKAAMACVAVFGLSPAWAAPDTFTIDKTHTYPMFEVSHFGISTQRGRFEKTTGKIVLDRAAKTGSIDVTIDTTSISMGFEEWNQHVRGEDLFNTGKFPVITFKSNKLTFEGDKPVAADGEFTLLGVTKPLRLKIANFDCTEHPLFKKLYCGAEVTAQIKRSDFGMTKGIPIVGDDVRLISPVEALKD
jgi:polyisoprenoid-binding protein YceI